MSSANWIVTLMACASFYRRRGSGEGAQRLRELSLRRATTAPVEPTTADSLGWSDREGRIHEDTR